MERITYILGAGFSAPLGLPVMRDFLTKSKDLYFSDKPTYKHFEQVFALIRDLSVTKNYFESDLFNIEEILSILEMQVFVEKRRLKKAFIRYVCDVITHCTPSLEYRGIPGNWQDFIFGGTVLQRTYGHFFGNILGLNFERVTDADQTVRRFAARVDNSREQVYSIITLNYDMVPKNFASFVNEHYEAEKTVGFDDQLSKAAENRGPVLAKLHGSADSGVIVGSRQHGRRPLRSSKIRTR